MSTRPRLLFVITEDWYFWSHRLDLARAARDAGFEVIIATRVTGHGEQILEEGFRLLPLTLLRRGRNPFSELRAILELVRLYRRERPDIVHHVALKPILYGSFAAWIARVPTVINAFAGLGYTFTDRSDRSGCLQLGVRLGLKTVFSLNHRSLALFQNSEDRDRLVHEGIVAPSCSRIIPGSGVDVERFCPREETEGVPVVMLASRMLWDKGVGEFVQAARQLQERRVQARFVLVGRCDEDNPAAIVRSQLQQWGHEGVIEWWEHRDDMPVVLASATVVTLPSYREGLPKVLLEAAACGKPVVAADVPGCREVVRHQVNGLLVPAKNPVALAEAIGFLLDHPVQRAAMGVAAREIVVREYSVPKVACQMLDFYRELLGQSWEGRSSLRNV